jgi:hypothetical protein
MHVSSLNPLETRISDAINEICRFQMAERPRSTDNSTPFTKRASSGARNSATVAISSERPIFPRGIRDSNSCLVSMSIRCESGVSIRPGLSTFTRILLPFSLLSQVRANERNVALLAEYTPNTRRNEENLSLKQLTRS